MSKENYFYQFIYLFLNLFNEFYGNFDFLICQKYIYHRVRFWKIIYVLSSSFKSSNGFFVNPYSILTNEFIQAI